MFGQSGSQSDMMMDEVDDADLTAMRKAEMDKLQMKMQKTMERIKAEQREKEGEWGEGKGWRGGVGEVCGCWPVRGNGKGITDSRKKTGE